MPDDTPIEHELREGYPRPSTAATARARAAVTNVGSERWRHTRRWRLAALALAATTVAAGATAAFLAFHGSTTARAGIPSFNAAATYSTTGAQPAGECPALYRRTPDGPSPYSPALSDSAGPAGSTVTISAPLPVLDEGGNYVGPGNPDITAYWNLDFEHWDSVLRSNESPVASVAGVPVDDLGTHHVSGGCNFQMQITIPGVPPGTYPVVFLYKYPDPNGGWGAAAIPSRFRVTAG